MRPVHVEGGQLVRISQLSDLHIATVGRPDMQLKVTHIKNKHPILTAPLQVCCHTVRITFMDIISASQRKASILTKGDIVKAFRPP